MSTLTLFLYKGCIMQKMPLFNTNNKLSTVYKIIAVNFIHIEKVTQFIMETPDDFVFENVSNEVLHQMCNKAKQRIHHHFITVKTTSFSRCYKFIRKRAFT